MTPSTFCPLRTLKCFLRYRKRKLIKPCIFFFSPWEIPSSTKLTLRSVRTVVRLSFDPAFSYVQSMWRIYNSMASFQWTGVHLVSGGGRNTSVSKFSLDSSFPFFWRLFFINTFFSSVEMLLARETSTDYSKWEDGVKWGKTNEQSK